MGRSLALAAATSMLVLALPLLAQPVRPGVPEVRCHEVRLNLVPRTDGQRGMGLRVVNVDPGDLDLHRDVAVEREVNGRWESVGVAGLQLRDRCETSPADRVTVARDASLTIVAWSGMQGDAQCDCTRCASTPAGRYRFRVTAWNCAAARHAQRSVHAPALLSAASPPVRQAAGALDPRGDDIARVERPARVTSVEERHLAKAREAEIGASLRLRPRHRRGPRYRMSVLSVTTTSSVRPIEIDSWSVSHGAPRKACVRIADQSASIPSPVSALVAITCTGTRCPWLAFFTSAAIARIPLSRSLRPSLSIFVIATIDVRFTWARYSSN
jgi:hypothetical protein